MWLSVDLRVVLFDLFQKDVFVAISLQLLVFCLVGLEVLGWGWCERWGGKSFDESLMSEMGVMTHKGYE